MKSLLYIVLVLAASLVATSLDAAPDPPAVNPHVLDVKIAALRQIPSSSEEQRIHSASPWLTQQLPLRRIDLSEMVMVSRPGDEIALVGYAADPSPPVLL